MPLALICAGLRAPLRRPLALLCATLLIAMLGGCAPLPRDVPRPVSTALQATAGTALATLVAEHSAAANTRFASGFVLLAGPQAAYGSRLALVEAAQKTLDLQYYAIHADASAERLLLAVVAAARRGVRVRVLLDDFHSTGKDAQVMRLAFEPNIEMRMFNPVAGARGSALGRLVSALGDFSRVQQRMHNKLFIADNAMGIAGGRNLGDAYFGHDSSGNFVDLDVLAAGPIVQDLSRSFDSYWNNERAYPVQSLVTRQALDDLRASLTAAEALPGASAEPAGLHMAASGAETPASTALAPDAAESQRSRVWDRQPLDLASARFVWAPAVVLVDQPAKIAAQPTDQATEPPPPPARDAFTPRGRGGAAAPRPSPRTASPRTASPGCSTDGSSGRP